MNRRSTHTAIGMGPSPRSLVAEVFDCFMVRFLGGSNRMQVSDATCRAPRRLSPVRLLSGLLTSDCEVNAALERSSDQTDVLVG